MFFNFILYHLVAHTIIYDVSVRSAEFTFECTEYEVWCPVWGGEFSAVCACCEFPKGSWTGFLMILYRAPYVVFLKVSSNVSYV